MSAMRLIEGEVEDPRDRQIAELRDELQELTLKLQRADAATWLAKQEANRALEALRRQLGPLYRALQAVFGELDSAGVADDAAPSAGAGQPAQNSRVAAVWASWKSKLGRGEGKVIDALLVHGEMNTQQLAIAIGQHRNSIPRLIFSLNRAGLIDKAGGRFSLKKL